MPDETTTPRSSSARPSDALAEALARAGNPGCVGLDPVIELIPSALRRGTDAEAIGAFCTGVIDAVAGVVGVVKPQSACFERFGSGGYAALERVIAHARDRGLVVVLDAKRGDIGSSGAHYAAGAAGMGVHWITVSPYMGPSTIEPFLDAGLGVFALCRTSNPDSDALQSLVVEGGRTVAEHTGAMLASLGAERRGACGMSDLGAVIGATKSAEDGRRLRACMPVQFFLVPGVGAQGGTPDEVRTLTREGARGIPGAGVVVNASRSVLYPGSVAAGSVPVGSDSCGRAWQDAVASAAGAFARSLGVITR